MLRTLLSVAAVATLAASLSAQSQVPVYKAVAPQFAGTFDPGTGTLIPGGGSRLGPDSIYNNNILTNYYSVPGQDQEWIDEGQLCDRGFLRDEQINGFNFTYCSTEADPTQNSGTITFTIYDDYTICAGPTNGGNFANGGFICAYDIVGLPLGDPNGVVQCWIVTIDLMGGFECPNGIENSACDLGRLTTDEANGKLFGWGIIPRNNNTGPWLAAGGKGADNAFTWFDQFGIFQGCFWFGGAPFASFAFQAFGNPENCIALNPCAPLPNDNLEVAVIPNGNIRDFVVNNPQPGETYWLVASTLCGPELPLPTGMTVLVNVPTIVPQTPAQMFGNQIQVTGPPVGRVYFQVVCTPNQNPPSPSNLPVRGSQIFCEVFG